MGSNPQARPVLVYGDDPVHAHSVAARAAALLRPGRAIEIHGPMTPRAILARARDQHVAAIVVASHGGPPQVGPFPGDVSTALAHRADVPVLVIHEHGDSAAAEGDGPALVCYDASDEARAAVDAAVELLAVRELLVASFLEPVDDVALLRQTLPWPPPAATERRLARLDQQEAEFLSQLPAEGAARAAARGREARSLAVEGRGSVSDRLLELAANTDASCIVVGHRSATASPEGTVLKLVHHSRRPVLVVPC